MTKKELFLMLAACTLSGIVIGLLTAPFTHGIRVSCGNNNGNNNGNRLTDDQKEEQDHWKNVNVLVCVIVNKNLKIRNKNVIKI